MSPTKPCAYGLWLFIVVRGRLACVHRIIWERERDYNCYLPGKVRTAANVARNEAMIRNPVSLSSFRHLFSSHFKPDG